MKKGREQPKTSFSIFFQFEALKERFDNYFGLHNNTKSIQNELSTASKLILCLHLFTFSTFYESFCHYGERRDSHEAAAGHEDIIYA